MREIEKERVRERGSDRKIERKKRMIEEIKKEEGREEIR